MRAISEGAYGCPAASLGKAVCHKADFIAILAHELRHPLAPISSGLDFLRRGDQDPATVTKTLDMMGRQVGQLTQLVNDLFDVVGLSSGQVGIRKKPVELNSVLWSAIETSLPVIEAAGHQLVLNIPDASAVIEADAGRISQVVVNLLNNAAKYTPPGGHIELAAYQEGSRVLISVKDSGIGIAEQAFAAIFEMFSQLGHDGSLASGGLGIGLSLVRQLVALHGGTVSVASPGKGLGSTFTVGLPLAQLGAEAAVALPVRESAQASPESLRMLIVDDHVDAAQMLAMSLQIDGHKTAVACDSRQALDTAAAFRPEIVFLDIEMPGMNGYETAQAMRKLAGLEKITLVALTGWGDLKSRTRSREAGFDYHLDKPTALETVRSVIATIAKAKAGGGPGRHPHGN